MTVVFHMKRHSNYFLWAMKFPPGLPLMPLPLPLPLPLKPFSITFPFVGIFSSVWAVSVFIDLEQTSSLVWDASVFTDLELTSSVLIVTDKDTDPSECWICSSDTWKHKFGFKQTMMLKKWTTYMRKQKHNVPTIEELSSKIRADMMASFKGRCSRQESWFFSADFAASSPPSESSKNILRIT